MISKQSIDEIRRMNDQLGTLESRIARLFEKMNRYLEAQKNSKEIVKSNKLKTSKKRS
jgi:hypothetical protein